MKIVNAVKTVEKDFFGVILEIARSSSAIHIAATQKAIGEIKIETGREELTDEDYREVNVRSIPGTILVGWSNFNIEDQEIEYTVENAMSLLRDDEYAYEFIMRNAMMESNFFHRSQELSVKKSLTPSDGKLSTAPA